MNLDFSDVGAALDDLGWNVLASLGDIALPHPGGFLDVDGLIDMLTK